MQTSGGFPAVYSYGEVKIGRWTGSKAVEKVIRILGSQRGMQGDVQ